MKLICLGVNGPFPSADGATSGYLLTHENTRLQLDLGSGVLAALTALTPPEELTAVVMSHWHFDHACDLLALIYRMESLAAQGASPLDVYGPVDRNSPVRQALLASPAFRVHDVIPGQTMHLGEVQVRSFPARHPVPAVMYRFSAGGKTLCYTGDTNQMPGLEEFAWGCDLLLADGLFPEAAWTEGKPHLSAKRAAQLAADAGVGKLVITHLHPGIDPEGLLAEAREVRLDAELARRFAVYTL